MNQPLPPSRSRLAIGWCIAVALVAEIAFATLNLSTMPVYLTQARGLSERWVGIALAGFLLSETLLKSRLGAWADRVGPQRPILTGAALGIFSTACTLLMPMWPGLAVSMVALRLVDGVAAAMIWPSVFLWAASSAHDETERQKVMGWVNTCYLVGVALAFPLGGFANDLSRWTGAGIVASGVLFVVLAGLALVSGASDKSSAPAHAERVEGGASSAAWPYMVVGFLIFAAIGFPSFIAKLLPIQVFKISESAVGASVLPAALGLAVLAGPVSRLGARLGAYRAMMLGLALSLVGSTPLALATTLPSLQTLPVLIGCALPLGVGFLLAMPAWYARVAEIDPARKGQNLGAVMAAQGVGAVVAGPTGTWLFELAPFSPFLGTFALLLIGTAVASSASFRPQEPPAM